MDTQFWVHVNLLIKTQNKTQAGLSADCGFSSRRIQNLSGAGRMPDVIEAYKIAQALNTTVEYLVTGKETNPDTQKLNNLLTQLQELINTNKSKPFTSPKPHGHQEGDFQADTPKA